MYAWCKCGAAATAPNVLQSCNIRLTIANPSEHVSLLVYSLTEELTQHSLMQYSLSNSMVGIAAPSSTNVPSSTK
jgi:hypothetical protein